MLTVCEYTSVSLINLDLEIVFHGLLGIRGQRTVYKELLLFWMVPLCCHHLGNMWQYIHWCPCTVLNKTGNAHIYVTSGHIHITILGMEIQ